MQTKGEETKAHILESAYVVFAHKGYTQVTMKDICEVTGLSRGGLYRHYDSCEQIFSDILSSFTNKQTLRFKEYIDEQLPASQILDMVLDQYKKEMLDSSRSLTLAIYEFYHQNKNHKQIPSLHTQYIKSYQAWKELLQYGIERNEFFDVNVESLYHLLIFSYQGVRMYSTIMTIDEKTVNSMMEQIKQLLIKKERIMNNTSIQLRIPTLEMKERALRYRKEHFDYNEHIIYGSELFDQIESYEEWLDKITKNTQEASVSFDWVVTDTFFAVDTISNEIIGIIDLRHTLNDFLKDFGHCGYSVRPTQRHKGYGAQMLSQICHIAKQHHMTQLQLSVETTNTYSIKTILKNGGVYMRSFIFEHKQADIYRIDL